ncbi:MAG: N-acetylneuraminate synthase family protein [Pseudomonadota bacterium]
MQSIRVGSRSIGPGHPAFLVAEIGINHNGDMQLAKHMIDAAIATGADAVKFQNYRTEDFLSDYTLTYTYQSQGQSITESQFDMFKRCELSAVQLKDLNDYCEKNNIVFFSTPTGNDGIQDLVNVGSPLLKNGSDYLTHLPLIQSMARTGLPTILSTGMATLEEITDAVRSFEKAGGKKLIILHCTSSYPTPASEVNLRKISTLMTTFNYPVGLSDHSWGTTAALGSIVLGACFIEKHFTLNKNLPGPDHRFSSDPEEFTELVKRVREIEQNIGSFEIKPTASELPNRINFRLSCVANGDLPEGHTLTLKDIGFRRPGHGLPPKKAETLIGKILKNKIKHGDVFQMDQFEDTKST